MGVRSILRHWFGLRLFRVVGESMEPTLWHGALVLADCSELWLRSVDRFTLVVLRLPGSDSHIVKRIAGFPKEEIMVSDGAMRVNGETVQEPLGIRHGSVGEWFWVLCKDEFVVLGDNRDFSADSRKFGFVKSSSFVGVAVAFWNPPWRNHRVRP